MTPEQYTQWLEGQLINAVQTAAAETAQATARSIQQTLPSKRQKTRKAVRHQVAQKGDRIQMRIRLQFAKQYPIENTTTARLFRRAWQRTRPNVLPSFAKTLTSHLKRI